MGKSIRELKRELEREKNISKSRKEIEDIGRERKRLSGEIKSIRRIRRFGGIISATKTIKGVTKKGISFAQKRARIMEDNRRTKKKTSKRKGGSSFDPLGSTQNWRF